MDPDNEDLPQYEHIYQNEFSYRKHKKQKEEDIAICECKFDFSDPDSACGERCLNVLTSTECTPGYCPCGVYCKNQKFQKCQYPRTTLFKTEGRGWGLRSAENMKAGQFIIEYCGEVISWKEAKRRSQAYEALGLRDAYIISLNGTESIDATKKGSLARFINHSCQPNCETRKWTVLGEIRVGIFAKQDVPVGTELAYDYNFEWYGGAKVRCLCGAPSCSGFLGAKSRGFQEDTYLWEDDDERYSVEKIPLYDSAEDEPEKKLIKSGDSNFVNDAEIKQEPAVTVNVSSPPANQLETTTAVDNPVNTAPMGERYTNALKTETTEDVKLYPDEVQKGFSQEKAMISHIQSNSACRNYHIKMGPTPKKRSRDFPKLKSKPHSQKKVEAKQVIQLLSSKEAQEEVVAYEEKKNAAASQLSSLYDEIRPAIEEHERDNQDSVSTSVGEKWIGVHCLKLKTEFDFFSSIVKNILCDKPPDQSKVSDGLTTNEVKYLEF